MTGMSASGRSQFWRPLAFLSAIALAVGLSGCGDVDEALFGDSTPSSQATYPGEQAAPAAQPSESGDNGAASAPVTELPTVTVTRIAIAEGQPTGTAVGQKAQEVRTTLMGLQDRIEANAQRLAALRQSDSAYSASYNSAKAQITSRLQLGTTRGNPELVQQWNSAQDSLDHIAADINALNALGADIASDDSQAHFTLQTIQATYPVSGAVDEDHRQLNVLEDETNQSIVLIERLLTNASRDVQRQTSYVANERSNLTTLANAIKNGEIYGATLGPTMVSAGPPMRGSASTAMAGGTPLVTIKFDRPNVEYQQILYTALAQALERRPDAGFEVVAVAPTSGTASGVQLTQSETQRNAQAVMRSMTDMGVPANRLALSSTTDPTVGSGEVRVYLR
jgi:hypothetical protein